MISFVYFDLGGVVEIDFSGNDGWEELKEELGIPEEKFSEFDKIYAEYERKICTSLNIEDFKEILNRRLQLHLPESYSLMHGFVHRFEKNPSIWPVIADIHKKARVGLFTMMYPGMFSAINAAGIIPQERWDIIIDSSEVGYVKSENEMYHLAQKEANIPADQILLVENSQKYIDKAKLQGWQTFLYNPKDRENSSKKLEEFFNKNRE